MWTWWEACLVLCPAAALGGAINSIAGGGTLITFPALMLVLGNAPGAAIVANATNTVALCPGSVTGTWAYRRELNQILDWARWLAIPSIVGGVVGSLIVVWSPESSFKAMVPWLIGLATVLFILQPKLVRASPAGQDFSSRSAEYRWIVFALQLLIGIYGGYFGAGIGILMLSSLSMLHIGNIHHVNGLKTILASLINGVSVVIFVWQGVVDWRYAVPMIVSAMIGGWAGAAWARTLNKQLVRRVVIGIGLVLTTWYFTREFLL
ncbi:MAG: sulfite exporter TauE/SafE family protein [Planctomyces sp.]|nr:sulfite exporter TauE/SafE family protein [Planctomyces sp.]